MKDYTTLKEGCLTPAALQDVPGFCRRFGLEGIEVFMDDVKNRTEVLFAAETEKEALVDRLAAGSVKRIHCSYWAYPTSFSVSYTHLGPWYCSTVPRSSPTPRRSSYPGR